MFMSALSLEFEAKQNAACLLQFFEFYPTATTKQTGFLKKRSRAQVF